jgi:hypothetical protein
MIVADAILGTNPMKDADWPAVPGFKKPWLLPLVVSQISRFATDGSVVGVMKLPEAAIMQDGWFCNGLHFQNEPSAHLTGTGSAQVSNDSMPG